ncbi:MAG: transposase [Verrucomicrobium sp.]|nr:hypothetical protein [Verrucomicrobium sp.]
MLTAACFEHQSIIGKNAERMTNFEDELISSCAAAVNQVLAWVVLPNHYHVLVQSDDVRLVLAAMGRLHGRTAFLWNGEDDLRGRQVWFRCVETLMKSENHFWATMNYIHHNPVKHGYAGKWMDWPYSSASEYLETIGQEEAAALWKMYPIKEYGRGWDE